MPAAAGVIFWKYAIEFFPDISLTFLKQIEFPDFSLTFFQANGIPWLFPDFPDLASLYY